MELSFKVELLRLSGETDRSFKAAQQRKNQCLSFVQSKGSEAYPYVRMAYVTALVDETRLSRILNSATLSMKVKSTIPATVEEPNISEMRPSQMIQVNFGFNGSC